MQRRESIRAERNDYKGLVWTEGFAVESGLAIDHDRLLEEDSFLGELLRLAGRSEQSSDELDEIISSALKPLMENQELRRLLMMTSNEEKIGWLQSAAELGITLLSGVEDSSEEATSLSYRQAGGQTNEN